jgi:hypothetical protein
MPFLIFLLILTFSPESIVGKKEVPVAVKATLATLYSGGVYEGYIGRDRVVMELDTMYTIDSEKSLYGDLEYVKYGVMHSVNGSLSLDTFLLDTYLNAEVIERMTLFMNYDDQSISGEIINASGREKARVVEMVKSDLGFIEELEQLRRIESLTNK